MGWLAAEQTSKATPHGRGATFRVPIRHLPAILPPALLYGSGAEQLSAPSQIPTYFPTPGHPQSQLFVVERGLRVPGRTIAILATDCSSRCYFGGRAIAGASGQRLSSRFLAIRMTRLHRIHQQGVNAVGRTKPSTTTSQTRLLNAYRARLWRVGNVRTDIFTYVYGVLHSPDYRERYADDLARTVAAHP